VNDVLPRGEWPHLYLASSDGDDWAEGWKRLAVCWTRGRPAGTEASHKERSRDPDLAAANRSSPLRPPQPLQPARLRSYNRLHPGARGRGEQRDLRRRLRGFAEAASDRCAAVTAGGLLAGRSIAKSARRRALVSDVRRVGGCYVQLWRDGCNRIVELAGGARGKRRSGAHSVRGRHGIV